MEMPLLRLDGKVVDVEVSTARFLTSTARRC